MTSEEWLSGQFRRCSHWLQAALNHMPGTHTLDDVWTAIEKGDAQLWPMPNSVAVTTLEQAPTGLSFVHIWLAGGDLTELQAVEHTIAEWGRSRGCSQIHIVGREGWQRHLSGYRRAAVILVRELTKDQ